MTAVRPHLAEAVAALESASAPRPAPEVEVYTAADLAVLALPEPRWAVRGLLPEGVVILAGPPKTGKSWLALGVTYAVAAGGHALGVPVQAGGAAYFALEDTRRRLQGRLRVMTSPGEVPPGRLLLATSLPLMDAAGAEWLARFAAERPELRLIVLDTLARCRPPRPRNADPHAEDTALISRLQAVAAEARLCLVLVAHTRKRDVRHGEPDSLESVAGTMALTGCADAVLVLRRARLEREARLSVTGRDIEERELALEFDPSCGVWSVLGDAAAVAATENQRRLVEALRAAGGQARVRELAALAGWSDGATKQVCLRLVASGVLARPTVGVYSLKDTNMPTIPAVPCISPVPPVPPVPCETVRDGTRVARGGVPLESPATTDLIGGDGSRGTGGTPVRRLVEV